MHRDASAGQGHASRYKYRQIQHGSDAFMLDASANAAILTTSITLLMKGPDYLQAVRRSSSFEPFLKNEDCRVYPKKKIFCHDADRTHLIYCSTQYTPALLQYTPVLRWRVQQRVLVFASIRISRSARSEWPIVKDQEAPTHDGWPMLLHPRLSATNRSSEPESPWANRHALALPDPS